MKTESYLFIQQPVVAEGEPTKEEGVWKVKEFGCCGQGICEITLEMNMNVLRLG